jgi:hypothetical protein
MKHCNAVYIVTLAWRLPYWLIGAIAEIVAIASA